MEDQTCRVCGCTERNCTGCVLRTGLRCSWVETDLCSACTPEALEQQRTDLYVVWSNEHNAWWMVGGFGYVNRLSGAARYTRAEAVQICINAMPGARKVLHEIPVRLADIATMSAFFRAEFGTLPWPLT
jgi:hypothetical protein